ncbi:substrate-binding domain-containing protein [Caballeronia sp. LZ032]|uniref:substrate-binding domain-containing protein n=1 Tax=Caballeronia sp. LZ032 TaxID=3038565 RepID=UPI0028554E9C|nr:substrate-binding domain-containing protein [Caballeronia sp. LZ032]MDR5880284.1 substrate-binding domain-containing protein [Caballeronia sp. LZ032]
MNQIPDSSFSLMSTLAVKRALVDTVIPSFEAEHGIEVQPLFDPTNVLQQRISDGTQADVLIATRACVQRLAEDGIVAAPSVRALVRTGVGVAVAGDVALPFLHNVDALRTLLLDARSVAYSQTGASGVYFSSLLRRLGIAEQVDARATIIEKGLTGECILRGEADVAIQQMSELAMVNGIALAGPLPEEVQHYTDFDVAMFDASAGLAASAAFVEALFSATARHAYARFGLTVF